MPKKLSSRKPPKPHKPAKAFCAELALRLFHHLRDNHWASPGQRIGVAVSGGADSVALLLLLLELRQKLGIVFSVVHFNHKLRGRASDADERFVALLAANHSLPCFIDHESIAAKSKRERTNLEDAARRGRYAYFERLVAERQLDRIAVAHTANDQAETVMAHILRGTGLAGLGGIHPEIGCVFRPLLQFRRTELRDYLRAQRQTWREDATNRDTKRTRARIRLKLMPLLEKHFQPAVVEHLCQLADLARADEAWLKSAAELRVTCLAKETNDEVRIAIADLLGPAKNQSQLIGEEEHRMEFGRSNLGVASRMIRRMVEVVKPHSGQLSLIHVDAVLRLAEQPDSGKSLHLPGGVEVRRQPGFLIFRPLNEKAHAESLRASETYNYTVELGVQPVELALPQQSCCLRFTVIDWPPQGRETSVTGAVLDRDRIRLPLVVRSWQPGDFLRPLGHQKRHKLSRLLNELGVSRWEKVCWPVLVSDKQVVWARGLPVCAELAANGGTRKAVLITEVALS